MLDLITTLWILLESLRKLRHIHWGDLEEDQKQALENWSNAR